MKAPSSLLVLLLLGCSQATPPPPAARVPYQHGIAAFGGELLGSDRGEWGGELAFRAGDGSPTTLLNANVVNMHGMPFGIVVVTGLAHLTVNAGKLLVVTARGPGRLRIDVLAALPHAPVASVQNADQSIDIALFSGRYLGGAREALPLYECVRLGVDAKLVPIACPAAMRGFTAT